MSRQEQIADFLRRRVPFSPSLGGLGLYAWPRAIPSWEPIPEAQQIACALMADAELQSLQLGSWIATTDGQVIAEAVSIALPPIYSQEFDLLVEDLELAAKLQGKQGRVRAGQIAVGVLAAALLLFAATPRISNAA